MKLRIFTKDQMSVKEFCEWSRDRPIAKLFPMTLRELRYAITGEIKGFIHRVYYVSSSKYMKDQSGSNYCKEKHTNPKMEAFKELNGRRPWITLYDYNVFMEGWSASEEWTKKQSFPGSCATCFYWKRGLNEEGVCRYSEINLSRPFTVVPSLITIDSFCCTNYEIKQGTDDKLQGTIYGVWKEGE